MRQREKWWEREREGEGRKIKSETGKEREGLEATIGTVVSKPTRKIKMGSKR